MNAQFYNKEYVGRIYVEKGSEVYTFTATAENLTPSDVNLRYEFTVYKADDNNNITKSSQDNLFFINGNEKVVLATAAVNNNLDGKITLLLVIYDKDDKPVGKDRIELNPENGVLVITQDEHPREEQFVAASQDQAPPQDGFVLDGLVVENTLTKAGRDFYKYFYSEYYNKQVQTKKNIVIEEVPGRFRSTRITVKVDDQIVWQFFSQPKKVFLQSMASTALDRAIRYLQQLQQNANSITRY